MRTQSLANLSESAGRLTLLRQVELFSELAEDELKRLAGRFVDLELPGHTHIFHSGDPSDSFYVVRSGSVAVYRDEVGKPVQLQARFGPGDFFGETGLFDGFQRSASARSSEPCGLLRIRKEDLLAFLDDHPNVLVKLQIAAARRHTLNVAAALDLGVRNEVRIRLDREVTLETPVGQIHRARLENLSLGGLCLRGAPASWVKGRDLDFLLSYEEESLPVRGQVSWREPETLGLAFSGTDSEHDAQVQSLLRRMLTKQAYS